MARFGSVTTVFGLNFSGSFTPTATITPGVNSVTEGGSVTFTIASNLISKQISYRVSHNGTSNTDFNPSSSVTGTITTTGTGSGTITLTTVNDLLFASGSKSFTVILSFDTKDIATSSSVTITDAATVTFGTKPVTISEGSSGTFNVTTSNLSNTTLYWRISYTVNVDAADFNASSGFFSITSGAGSFIVTPTADATTEGTQTFQVIISSTEGGPELANSGTIVINDASQNPTYAFGTIPTSINEGSSGTFNVTTTNVPNGTLYWTISHTSTAAADFSSTSGSFTITNNAGSFSVSPIADVTTEGAQTFQVQIRTTSITGTIVATSDTVTVNDTSIAPQITATSSAAYNNIYDEDYVTFYVTGPDSTGTYSYSVTSVNGFLTVSPVASPATGTFLGIGQVNSVTVHFKSGHSADTARITITRAGYTSVILEQVFAARTAKTYTVTPNVTSVNEGGTVNFTISRSDGATASGAIVDWNQTGTATQADFSSPTLWNDRVVLNSSGQATLSFVTVADSTTEGSQTLILELRKGSNVGDLLATSSTVTINDTSTTPPLTLTVNFPNITYTQGVAIPTSDTFSRPVTASGGNGTYYYEITPVSTLSSLDIFWNTEFGRLSGTPIAGLNATSFTITVTSGSQTATKVVTIGVQAYGSFTLIGSINDVTQNWIVPTGVTSISMICIGGGGGAGAYGLTWNTTGTVLRRHGGGAGGGGALSYRNTYTVTPGDTLTITAGKYGSGGGRSNSGGGSLNPDSVGPNGTAGGISKVVFGSTTLAEAGGGAGGTRSNYALSPTTVAGGNGGTRTAITGTAGGSGGKGGNGIGATSSVTTGISGGDGGGGGAGGYSGTGGAGGNGSTSTTTQSSGTAGAGGGGGGGAGGRGGAPASGNAVSTGGGAGGGVGALGTGTNGAGGVAGSVTTIQGGGGSGGNSGSSSIGGSYGGGGSQGRNGGAGYVRIIWPGSTRTFPSAAT